MSFLKNMMGGGFSNEDDASYKTATEGETIQVDATYVKSTATANNHAYDLSNKEGAVESSLNLLQQLKDQKMENEDKGEEKEVDANLKVEAKIIFSGKSAEAVSSGVNTASVLFNQFVHDVERLKRIGGAKDGNLTRKDSRVDMVQEFHASLTEVFLKMENFHSMRGDFNGIEDILAKGPEEYIKEIRKLFAGDQYEDEVTVWYRDLDYVATVDDGPTSSQETISTVCFNITLGPFVNAAKGLLNMCRSRAANVSDSGYQPLGSGANISVLKDLTGVINHSRLTLVLGPPGSGKTSFLKAIAGLLHRQRGVKAEISGEVYYNNFAVDAIKNLQNWSCYVSQRDDHLPLLTVRETLQFAYNCRKLARSKSDAVYAEMVKRVGYEAADRIRTLTSVEVDFVLAVLGLTACADTIIGNETLKGISGGEKRRVTLGEMMVTGAQVLLLDEISTGLDSAAAYDICRYLRAAAHFLGQAVVVSLLQPPPEVVDLFDDIILLAEGNVIYHGPREKVLKYFEDIGYLCPYNKDLADFLQELPTPSGRNYINKEFNYSSVPKTADEFGLAWKNSKEGKTMAKTADEEAERQHHLGNQRRLTWEDMPLNSYLTELRIVLSWSWTYRLRKKAEIIARIFQNVFMGLIFGSLFWQIGYDEWYLKAMLFAQMPGFMQAGCIGAVPKLVQERDVFYKHTYAKFYSASTFAISQFLVQVPFTIFDALCFGNLLYFMCGLVMDTYRYGVFMVLAILFGLCIGQLMRIFSYAVRTENGALVSAVLSYLLFLIFSGQVATPEVIPSYFKWFFWINPTAWVYRALAINEFKADKYGKPGENKCHMSIPFNGKIKNITVPERCGDFYLENRQFETDEDYVVYSFFLLIAYTIFFIFLTVIVLANVRFDREYTADQEEEEEEIDDSGLAQNGGSINGTGSMVEVPTLARCESLAVELKTLVFSDLWYSVRIGPKSSPDSTVDLLKGVSGFATPGRMTALMGSSGAGKTTLLDVLAGRKNTGKIRGHILINSNPPDPKTYKRMVGYVEQFGVHADQSTVFESLLFSAGLRLPAHSQHRKGEFVEEIMELLELDNIRDERTRALSVEQNKRLTIAVELVSNPSVLFADEPTSGLDARAASIVMRSIQNVARSGRTVICTIHQPSLAVFSVFDDLLLMKRGGEVVFFGELGDNCENLISYFEAIPGTSPCPKGYNPATWMLEVIGAGTGNTSDKPDYAALYKKSHLCKMNSERLEYEFMAPLNAEKPLQQMQYMFSPLGEDENYSDANISDLTTPLRRKVYHKKHQEETHALSSVQVTYSQPFWKQVTYLLRRNHRTYWRSPEFSLSRILVVLLVGIIITATFWQQDYKTAADTQSRIISISFMLMLTGAYNLFTIMPFQIEKRALVFREISSGMYSSIAAVFSDGLVEMPYLLVETIVGVNVVYWGIGFQQTVSAYVYYNITFCLYLYLMTSLGMFLSTLLPDALSAQLCATVVIQIFQLFAGVIVPYDKLPSYYKPMYYFSAQRYSTEAIITSQFHHDQSLICSPNGVPINDAPWPLKKMINGKFCSPTGHFEGFGSFTGIVQTAEDFVYNAPTAFLHGYKYSEIHLDFIVLISWCIGLRIATVIAALTVDHNKR